MCFRTNVSSGDVFVFVELTLLFLLFLKRTDKQDEDNMVAIVFSPARGNKFQAIKLLFNGSLVKTYGPLGRRTINSK